MLWQVRVRRGDASETAVVSVEADNWFGALDGALRALGAPLGAGSMEVALHADGRSATVEDRARGLHAEVLAPGAPAAAAEPPPVGSQTFTPEGKYSPGETQAFLAGAFMKLSDLYGAFGEDVEGAAALVLEFTARAFEAEGGGIALADINDPTGAIRFVVAFGPHAEALRAGAVVMGEGPVGLCASQGADVVVTDLASDDRFGPSGLLHAAGLREGPVLCVPIPREEWVQGAVLVYTGPRGRPFTPGQQEILDHLSGKLGEYLSACRAAAEARAGG